jgi:glutamate-1-semialdehyde aminotransferase/spore coat polysaccharide biosynthesis protein SpsF (cytidylyltransferase family)
VIATSMTTVAIIQARMLSTRLPGKVLADLSGMPVLAWVVRATCAAVGVDDVWVATSTAHADDAIAIWCKEHSVKIFRGLELDVLDRFARTALASAADVVVRITADCPFIDPSVIGQVIRLRAETGADYASNIDPRTWPDGLDCEVVTLAALSQAAKEAVRPSEREHVTPFIRKNRARFPAEALIAPIPHLWRERWTLDTSKDLEFLRAVAKRLPRTHAPSHLEILSVLDQAPELRRINAENERNVALDSGLAAKPLLDRKFTRSHDFMRRAEKVIPLGSQTFSKSRIQFPPNASPLFVTHGDGGRVFDIDGNDYVDLVSALMPNVLGYRDPDVDLAIRNQLSRGISFSLPTLLETELAERLVKHIPCAEMVRFAKNGTDATSAAIRLSRAWTKRDRVISLGYHGWQDWYIGATTRNLGVPKAVSALSHLAPYGDLAAVDALLSKHAGEFAAVILEPMNTAEPPTTYLADLKDLVHRHRALLIFDEIITGFRWSLGGAQARYGVTPDLACFGKAMGNGMPISAIVGRADIMHLMEDIFFSATFGGEALSLAASIATIDKLERHNVTDRLWQVGGELMCAVREKIAAVGLDNAIKIVGAAPWAILTFQDDRAASKEAIKTLFLREMIASGVLINASHNICFAHTPAEISRVLRAYDHALGVLASALKRGDTEYRLGNQVIRPIFTVRT